MAVLKRGKYSEHRLGYSVHAHTCAQTHTDTEIAILRTFSFMLLGVKTGLHISLFWLINVVHTGHLVCSRDFLPLGLAKG